MNKDTYIYQSKMIEGVFFFFLILIMIKRLEIGMGGVKVVEFLYERVSFLFVSIAVCFTFYRVDRYYQNNFVRIRYRNQKKWELAFLKETIKSSLLNVGLFYSIVFVCCFEMNVTYFVYLFLIVLQVAQIYIFCSFVNMRCSMMGKQFLSNLFCIFFNVGFSSIVLKMLPITAFYENMVGEEAILFNLITLLFVCLNLLMLIWVLKGFKKWKTVWKKGMVFVFCILLFVIQNAVLKNFYGQESLGFPDILFITINEILMPLFLWASCIILFISITLYVMFTNYRSHLLFYAIRIQNRTVWLLKTVLKGTVVLAIMLTVKYGINELFHNHTMSYGMYMIEGLLRIQFISLLMFLLYQIYKNEKLFSYGLLAYLILVLFCVSTHNGANLILMRVHDIETILLMAALSASMLFANCYAINHLDYY